MEGRTLLSAISWTGNAGDNDWDTPGNWSSSPALPGAADDVTINVEANVVHSINVTDSIHSLTSTQPLTIQDGTLSIAADSTLSSTLTQIAGTLNGAGNITVGGLLTLGSGTLGGTGTVTANGGIALSSVILDGKTLINPVGQTATWTGNGRISIERNGASFVNNGTVVEQAEGGLSSTGNAGAAVSFINNGSFTQSNNANFTVTGVAFNENSPGTVDVASGELYLFGGGTSTGGGFMVNSGATLSFGTLKLGGTGDTYTFDANSSIGGAGTVGFGENGGPIFQVNAIVTIEGSYDVTGTTALGSAIINFNGPVVDVGSTLTTSPSPPTESTAIANFNTTFLGSAGVIPTILMHGGTINFGTNPITATTLTLTPSGTNAVTGTSDITVSGLTTLDSGRLIGSGTVTANGGITSTATDLIIDGKTLINAVGQTATFTGYAAEVTERDGANFINNGTFVDQAGVGGGFNDVDNTGAPVSFTNNGRFIQSQTDEGIGLQHPVQHECPRDRRCAERQSLVLRRRNGDGRVLHDRIRELPGNLTARMPPSSMSARPLAARERWTSISFRAAIRCW